MINSVSDADVRRAADFEAPPATRVHTPRWRSPQLVVGVLLVLVSMVVGARVVAGADDTTPVLTASRDLAPGEPLTSAMVETRHVALGGEHGHYVTGAVGDGYVVVRGVEAGELVPRSALATVEDATAGEDPLRYLTLAVPSAEVPAGIRAGDAVDVWVTPAEEGEPERAAAELTVTEADTGGGLGMSGGQAMITLAVRGGGEQALDALVGRLIAAGRDGRVYLTKLP